MYSVVLLMALSGGVDVPAGHDCGGCWDSCSGCNGCSSSCHGGFLSGLFSHGHNCHGCCGGCTGCTGCYGSYGGYGCTGGMGCYGSGAVIVGDAGAVAPQAVAVAQDAPATIQVNLPADATLTVDGNATTSTSELRVFTSPTLPAGQEYFYSIKAEIVRDGQKLTAVERVAVKAGQETRLALPASKFAATVAAK
jgi:uncharacterized protein (TIGR03000 family)